MSAAIPKCKGLVDSRRFIGQANIAPLHHINGTASCPLASTATGSFNPVSVRVLVPPRHSYSVNTDLLPHICMYIIFSRL